jgi:hypothetical protein
MGQFLSSISSGPVFDWLGAYLGLGTLNEEQVI